MVEFCAECVSVKCATAAPVSTNISNAPPPLLPPLGEGNIRYYETSAKEDLNVDEAFMDVCRAALRSETAEPCAMCVVCCVCGVCVLCVHAPVCVLCVCMRRSVLCVHAPGVCCVCVCPPSLFPVPMPVFSLDCGRRGYMMRTKP